MANAFPGRMARADGEFPVCCCRRSQTQSCRFQLAETTTFEAVMEDRHEQALSTFTFAFTFAFAFTFTFTVIPEEDPPFLLSLWWKPIDLTVEVAVSNDLMLPSRPPATMVVASGIARESSGPDSMLCVSKRGLIVLLVLVDDPSSSDSDVSCTRTAPSQLVDARSLLLPFSLALAVVGMYRSAETPSGNLSRSFASGGGWVAILENLGD
mmetsp:Transcript_6518/g.18712  ORF Transcript_6518/g.18712 Transcript_6518/m.18712 type:complete len:210 (-) Transcript_6518:264-893(-)